MIEINIKFISVSEKEPAMTKTFTGLQSEPLLLLLDSGKIITGWYQRYTEDDIYENIKKGEHEDDYHSANFRIRVPYFNEKVIGWAVNKNLIND